MKTVVHLPGCARSGPSSCTSRVMDQQMARATRAALRELSREGLA